MRTHNAWHLAMFDTEDGNIASALRILDAWLLPASARSPLDACDATDLLWHLATAGLDDKRRWCRVSDAFERTLTPGFWPYVDLHAALAHLAAGQKGRAQQLRQAIEQCAQGENYAALRARNITLPGLRALGAWAEGRYGEAARLLANLQPILGDAGGSRVQLEIFKSIEHEAARQHRARLHDQLQPPTAKEQEVPLINVKLIEGVFSDLQKQQIAKSLTDDLVQIGGEAVRPVTLCVVDEVKSGDWVVGGQPLTTVEVKASIAARKVA